MVDTLLMEKLKSSYREFEMTLREKVEEQLAVRVTQGELKTQLSSKVSHDDLEEMLKTKVSSTTGLCSVCCQDP